MKNKGIKFFTFLLVLGAFVACKNNNKQGANASTDPAYQTPELKSITAKITKDPGNARLYYERGQLLHRRSLAANGILEDSLALLDFKKAVTLDSGKAEYYSAIGDMLFDHKDITGSLQWIQRAIKLNPQDPKAHMKIAKMLVYTKDYAKAFTEINTILRQDVYNPEGYFLKGMMYKDMHDTDKAISSFQTAVQVAPEYREAMIELGILYASRQNPMALKYYDNAFKLDTSDALPLYNKGMYYQDQQNYEQAKVEYKNCMLHDNQYSDAYFSTGWILMQQDSLDKAWRQYDLVTKIEPNNAQAYYNRGLCNELLNKKQDAINDYRQALVFDAKYKDATAALKRLGAK